MDKNIFGEVDNLPEEDKKRMTTMVEQLQTRDSSFYRSSLNKPEETCVLRCAGKYLRFSSHVGVKFSDINQGASTTDKQ
ncbi:import inner membrane translocase protein [Medicago truncatula]|uniref:Mitochondrial import inner membrane translocase subunit n=1 Tax=Medicago truncatula TaxID=3880 RepID=A0A072UIX3_MEDTR|nr:import inner membrane translocase protein [Medicago truncatula]